MMSLNERSPLRMTDSFFFHRFANIFLFKGFTRKFLLLLVITESFCFNLFGRGDPNTLIRLGISIKSSKVQKHKTNRRIEN